jgi:hypothetical protein
MLSSPTVRSERDHSNIRQAQSLSFWCRFVKRRCRVSGFHQTKSCHISGNCQHDRPWIWNSRSQNKVGRMGCHRFWRCQPGQHCRTSCISREKRWDEAKTAGYRSRLPCGLNSLGTKLQLGTIVRRGLNQQF